MPLIVPHFAVGAGDEITIDGVVYKVPRVDAAGRLYTNAYATGASEVKAARLRSSSPSTTRATVVTPTAGKKVRIISCLCFNTSATASRFQVYFGTGANITVNAGKEILDGVLDVTDQPTFGMVWPDGAGPVGAVDDVVSLVADSDITTNAFVLIHYREE